MRKISVLFSKELFRIALSLAFFIAAFITELLTRHLSFSLGAMLLYITALLIAGTPVFCGAVRGILRKDLLDEKFLMSVASIGAVIIGDMSEGVAVMLFFLVGEFFEHKAVARSRRSIKSLMDIRPDEATVIENGTESVVDAEDVAVGSEIVIKTGERVPIDAVVISGSADIDTSALTGEPIPRAVAVGGRVESGSVVVSGVINCRTVRLAEESAAARILDLVENASERKSREENFITVFSRFYTPIVVLLAIIMAVIPPLFIDGMRWSDSVYRALSFLVISCPCALVISVPMAFFGGIGGAASKGILFKGGNVFSALARADTFAFDKTGTLTSGEFSVAKTTTYGISEAELLYYAASAEYGSAHPTAKCIRDTSSTATKPDKYREIAGKGVVAEVDSHTVLVGNLSLLDENYVEINVKDTSLSTLIFVAVDGVHRGTLEIRDTVKAEAKSALSRLGSLGVKRKVMLSGDRRENAERVGAELGIDEIKCELLPEDKYSNLENIINSSKSTVYVGDGINDAPALARCDVGIAMGAIGTDSAIEAADVVIMSDNLEKIPTAVTIARKTMRIAKTNIVFALTVKLVVLILSALGFANMWMAVFADVGVAVIAILNSMRTLR